MVISGSPGSCPVVSPLQPNQRPPRALIAASTPTARPPGAAVFASGTRLETLIRRPIMRYYAAAPPLTRPATNRQGRMMHPPGRRAAAARQPGRLAAVPATLAPL